MNAAKDDKKRGGKGRTTVLGGLLLLVALIAAYLSDCIPGLGVGTGQDAPGEQAAVDDPEDEAEETTPEPKFDVPPPEPEAPTKATMLVDGRGCQLQLEGAEPGEFVECATLCEAEAPFGEATVELTVDARQGPHDDVVAVVDCAKAKGVDKVAIQRE